MKQYNTCNTDIIYIPFFLFAQAATFKNFVCVRESLDVEKYEKLRDQRSVKDFS